MQEEVFGFEHLQAHALLWANMSPLNRFSVLPYLIYPFPTNQAEWHWDHQQATNDAQSALPGVFGGIGFLDLLIGGIIPPEFVFPDIPITGTISQLAPGFNIQDYDLTIGPQLEWWTFQNHYWHLAAQSVLNSATFVFPFF